MTLINDYAGFLSVAGHDVMQVDDIDWYDYQGFMMPAYLPHCIPAITADSARRVLKASQRPFVRWSSHFGTVNDGPWWYVIRRGPFALSQCSSNTRSKIRRGFKRMTVRLAGLEEIEEQGHDVCVRAAARYDAAGRSSLPQYQDFALRLKAAAAYPDVVEYYAAFQGDRMVAFSENHLQSEAVFLENIWYDPDALKDYSSYAMTYAMLDDYLNRRKFHYVTDGCRSIYHDTRVQDFFVNTFGFKRQYARLNLAYGGFFGLLVGCIYPMRSIIRHGRGLPLLRKASAILHQEEIGRNLR